MTRLEELPQRIDELTGQILHMRAEIGSEILAVRSDLLHAMGKLHGHTMAEVLRLHDRSTLQIAGFRDEVMSALNTIQDRLSRR